MQLTFRRFKREKEERRYWKILISADEERKDASNWLKVWSSWSSFRCRLLIERTGLKKTDSTEQAKRQARSSIYVPSQKERREEVGKGSLLPGISGGSRLPVRWGRSRRMQEHLRSRAINVCLHKGLWGFQPGPPPVTYAWDPWLQIHLRLSDVNRTWGIPQ